MSLCGTKTTFIFLYKPSGCTCIHEPKKYIYTTIVFQNKPLGRQCFIRHIHMKVATPNMSICHQDMHMQKPMEPNGLTLECYLNSHGIQKPMGLYMHSSSEAHGLDCFAPPNQCEDPCSYKKNSTL